MQLKQGKNILAILFTLILFISFFSPNSVEAAKTKTGHVDIKSGVLNVRSGPGTKYKTIGTVKKNSKLTIYSETKNGWAETKLENKKGYVSNEFIRYYKKMSNAEAKKITDKAIKAQRKTTDDTYTKKQISNFMSHSFTQSYINKFIKKDFDLTGRKDKFGNPIYAIRGTDNPWYYIREFEWKANGYYAPSVPTVKYYVKNGKQYLYINQKTFSELHDTNQKLYLSRTSSKANWKVYNYTW